MHYLLILVFVFVRSLPLLTVFKFVLAVLYGGPNIFSQESYKNCTSTSGESLMNFLLQRCSSHISGSNIFHFHVHFSFFLKF
jgi:hypothetical protein